MANVAKKVAPNRAQEAVNVASPGRVREARKNGPHGKVHHADGSTQAEKNKHKPTDGKG
jgi:hypothetical protein